MSETILAVLITGAISVLTTVITVIMSSKTNRDRMTAEIDKRLAVSDQHTTDEIAHIKTDIQEMKADIKEHNGYAKMFAASSAVFDEKFKVVNHRLDDLEKKVG